MNTADCLLEASWWQASGLLGALDIFEQKKYNWQVVTGTGAGAIIAALLAAGYTHAEISHELEALRDDSLLCKHTLTKLPLIGWIVSLMWNGTVMKVVGLEEWLRGKLADKGVHTFGDLLVRSGGAEATSNLVKLNLVVSDITRRRMITLPVDIVEYEGYDDPLQLDVAFAVRMAATTPLMFEPVTLKCKESCFPEETRLPSKSVWQYIINSLWRFPKARECTIVEGRIFRDNPVLPLTATRRKVPSIGFIVRNAFPFDQPVLISNPLTALAACVLTRNLVQRYTDPAQRFWAVDIQGAPFCDESRWFLQYAFGIDAALKHFMHKPSKVYIPPHARGVVTTPQIN